MSASDLLTSAAAAWASASIVYRRSDPEYSSTLLNKAESIYAWGISNEGIYSKYYTAATSCYPSTSFLDHQTWAAGWLYLATRNTSYLNDAASFWQRSYGKNASNADIFSGWYSVWAPAAVLMRQISRTGVEVPEINQFNSFFEQYWLPSWVNAEGELQT